MKKINKLFFIILFTFYFGTTFSQALDSLEVFPNPFESSTTIYFDIAKSDTITLRVTNRLGQTIMSFFQSTFLPSGSYNVNFLGDTLADGLYFAILNIGSTKTLYKRVFKANSTLIFETNKVDNKYIIFPNPTNDYITIPIGGNKTIIITDLKGKIVKSLKTDQQTISLLDIAAGQYFITVFTNKNEKLTTQLILKF